MIVTLCLSQGKIFIVINDIKQIKNTPHLARYQLSQTATIG